MAAVALVIIDIQTTDYSFVVKGNQRVLQNGYGLDLSVYQGQGGSGVCGACIQALNS